MPPKRNTEAGAPALKRRKSITMEVKLEVIKRAEKGEGVNSIGKALGFSHSTISTILKDKCKILEHMKGSTPMQSTMISKKRTGLIVEMERLLMIWLEDQNQRHIPVSLALVQEKARCLFNDIKARRIASGVECNEDFNASRGWFNRFRKRANIHSIRMQGEAADADAKMAAEYPETFKTIIEEGGYLPCQIWNVDETGLYWKKLPSRTYISREEKSASGHKPAKDRLTLLLGGNASGDCKLKPMLVYKFLNPRALTGVIKASLPVIWRQNDSAWVTIKLFENWFKDDFVPEVERYCKSKKIPFKILLTLDNAPGHGVRLDELNPNVKVVYLPANTTSIIQPMDQGVIATFKAYYLRRTLAMAVRATEDGKKTLKQFWKDTYNIYEAIKNIAASWNEVSESCMKGVWNKLCPQFACTHTGFTADDVAQANKALADVTKARASAISLSNQLELDFSEEDVTEVLDSHDKDLSNEDLIELEEQLIAHQEEEADTAEPKKFALKELSEVFSLAETMMVKLENQDPDTERFTKVYRGVMEQLSCYRIIYEEKKKKAVQPSIQAYFKKMAAKPKSPVPGTSRDEDWNEDPDEPPDDPPPLSPASSH